VYGVVRDAAHQRPLANATVEMTWTDLTADKYSGIHQKRFRSLTRTDATGSYGVCGVPTDVGIRVQASNDSSVSGLIDLEPRDLRVRRRDLVVGRSAASDSVEHGSIVGLITDAGGQPFPNARLVMDEAPEVRSGSDGRFTIRNVPPGTRQVEIMSVGMAPVVTTVDVVARDSVPLSIQLRRVTTLDVVRVTASARQKRFFQGFTERQRLGLGHAMDSTEIGARGTMAALFGGFASTEVRSDRYGRVAAIMVGAPRCAATLWIDGFRQPDAEELSSMHPDEIAVVEVFPFALMVPVEFMSGTSRCGAVVIWTKRGMR